MFLTRKPRQAKNCLCDSWIFPLLYFNHPLPPPILAGIRSGKAETKLSKRSSLVFFRLRIRGSEKTRLLTFPPIFFCRRVSCTDASFQIHPKKFVLASLPQRSAPKQNYFNFSSLAIFRPTPLSVIDRQNCISSKIEPIFLVSCVPAAGASFLFVFSNKVLASLRKIPGRRAALQHFQRTLLA